jgi:transcriptional regulator with XRE-family HTH domain
MSDLQDYIKKRKQTDPEFADKYDVGYENFKIGIILREMRKESGFTQQELANKLNTKKSVISRIENHAEDIRLSTLNKYAEMLGRSLKIQFISNSAQSA